MQSDPSGLEDGGRQCGQYAADVFLCLCNFLALLMHARVCFSLLDAYAKVRPCFRLVPDADINPTANLSHSIDTDTLRVRGSVIPTVLSDVLIITTFSAAIMFVETSGYLPEGKSLKVPGVIGKLSKED